MVFYVSSLDGKMDEVIRALQTYYARGHLAFEGLPGTGKTRFVEFLAEKLNKPLSILMASGDTLEADILGRRELRSRDGGSETVFEKSKHMKVIEEGGIFYIDEAIALRSEIWPTLFPWLDTRRRGLLPNGEEVGGTDYMIVVSYNPTEIGRVGSQMPEPALDRFNTIRFKYHAAEVQLLISLVEIGKLSQEKFEEMVMGVSKSGGPVQYRGMLLEEDRFVPMIWDSGSWRDVKEKKIEEEPSFTYIAARDIPREYSDRLMEEVGLGEHILNMRKIVDFVDKLRQIYEYGTIQLQNVELADLISSFLHQKLAPGQIRCPTQRILHKAIDAYLETYRIFDEKDAVNESVERVADNLSANLKPSQAAEVRKIVDAVAYYVGLRKIPLETLEGI
ncbi:MAG: AAA family ATPase [Candidatus Jordarchaeales archaeon]